MFTRRDTLKLLAGASASAFGVPASVWAMRQRPPNGLFAPPGRMFTTEEAAALITTRLRAACPQLALPSPDPATLPPGNTDARPWVYLPAKKYTIGDTGRTLWLAERVGPDPDAPYNWFHYHPVPIECRYEIANVLAQVNFGWYTVRDGQEYGCMMGVQIEDRKLWTWEEALAHRWTQSQVDAIAAPLIRTVKECSEWEEWSGVGWIVPPQSSVSAELQS